MPYFAYVQNNSVAKVERIEHEPMTDSAGVEQEALGQEFLAACYPGTNAADYILTYYPSSQPDPFPRGKYAGIGDLWDGTNFTSPVVEVEAVVEKPAKK